MAVQILSMCRTMPVDAKQPNHTFTTLEAECDSGFDALHRFGSCIPLYSTVNCITGSFYCLCSNLWCR